MKTLKILEKSRSFWSILIIAFAFFLLRLPSIIEPYWYGDEGIYEVIGQAINHGRLLYTDIWDNKPPLLYLVFALFNGDQEAVRLISLIVGLLSVIIFFCLSKKIFKKLSASIIAASFFAFFFATPFLEGNIANAENFMLLPILIAGLLIYNISTRHSGHVQNPYKNRVPGLEILEKSLLSRMTITGVLLGIAFLFKIVAVFDLAAFLLFIVISSAAEKSHTTHNLKHHIGMRSFHALRLVGMTIVLPILIGFIIPLTLTSLYFIFQNAFVDFIQAAFFGNIGYVGYGNKFLNIPQGLLIFKLILLAAVTGIIFIKRQKFSKATIFITIWLAFSLFNAFFSQRPYTHYLIVILPSLSLLIGLFFEMSNNRMRLLLLSFIACILIVVKENFWIPNPKKTALYYQNVLLFIMGNKDVKSYRLFFDRKTPRDYEVASIISKRAKANDEIFIWGDSAQIYALSHKLPLNKYTVAYHVRQNKKAMEDTQMAISTKRPKYIITLSESPALPFRVPSYGLRFVIIGASIYERNF